MHFRPRRDGVRACAAGAGHVNAVRHVGAVSRTGKAVIRDGAQEARLPQADAVSDHGSDSFVEALGTIAGEQVDGFAQDQPFTH